MTTLFGYPVVKDAMTEDVLGRIEFGQWPTYEVGDKFTVWLEGHAFEGTISKVFPDGGFLVSLPFTKPEENTDR